MGPQLRFHGTQDFRFDDVEISQVGPDEIRLRIAYNGICGSDLHFFDEPEKSDVPYGIDEAGNIIPEPAGHEYSGDVTEVGSAVANFAVGDRATVIPMGYCGHCDICSAGLPRFMCRNLRFYFGGIGEEIVVDHRHAYRLPEGVDLIQGALVEPMAVCYHAVQIAELEPESTAVAAGAGPIGTGIYFSLKAQGIENVIVSEPSADRRAIIEEHGARTIDPMNEDLSAMVLNLSDGLGASVFFDAAGAPPVFKQGLDLLAPRGKYVTVAIHTKPLELNLFSIQTMEKRIYTVLGYEPSDFDGVIAAMEQGAYPTEGWVEVRPARDVLEVINELKSGKGSKVLLNTSQMG